MRVCILTIGDELVEGKVDTNSAWMAQALDRIGWLVREVRHCRDNVDDIVRNLRELSELAPVTLTTGGLGPTTDDLTTESVARLTSRELLTHEPTWENIQRRFRERGLELPPSNIRQAWYPEGATPIPNPVGTALGYMVEVADDRMVAVFPGVPREMKAMVETTLLPELQRRYPRPGHRVVRSLHVFGHAESRANDLLLGLGEGVEGFELAYLVSYPILNIHIKVTRSSEAEAAEVAARLVEEARRRLGDRVYGFDGTSLPEAVGKLLAAKGLRMATAESCTGGLISAKVTDIPGSTGWFLEGVVSYSNEAKQKYLGVSAETLREYGAVSAETCEEMLAGILERSGADVAVAVTGIAGPGGGTPEKPVGLVYIGWGDREGSEVRAFQFAGGREEIRALTTMTALDRIRRHVLGMEGRG